MTKPRHFHKFFNPNFFWQFFPWNQSCQQLKSPKPQHFHEFFIQKKFTILSRNQSWIFGLFEQFGNWKVKSWFFYYSWQVNRITIVLWILKQRVFGLIKYHTRNYSTKSTKQNPKSQAAPDANDLKLLSISRWCTKPILRIYNCVKAGPNSLDDDYAFIPQYNKIKNKLEFRYLRFCV